MATLEIIYATDALLQNITKIVSLRFLIIDNLNYKPWKPWEITCANFSKSG